MQLRGKSQMTQNTTGSKVLGMIFIILPIAAALFGSDEPAMQTEQAPLVMTAMIVIGIIMLVNASNKQAASPPTTYSPAPATSVVQSSPSAPTSKFCPYCGAAISVAGARYCDGCGRELSNN